MKASAIFSTVFLAAALGAADLFIEAEKPFYQIGETITFKVTGREADEKITYTLDLGDKAAKPQELAGDTLTCKLDHPGFAFVEITAKRGGKTVKTQGGAAVEPEKIRTSTPRPADFDAFWDDAVAAQRKEPLQEVSRVEIPSDRPESRIFDVRLRRGKLEVTGYLTMPVKVSKENPAPGIAHYLGASQVNADFRTATGFPVTGWVAFVSNFQAMPNVPKITQEEKEARRKTVRDYQYINAGDREKYAMRDIFLRAVMVVDYLATLPEVDHDAIVVNGGSLGGCQALVAAALAPEKVRYCMATVPAMCDHFARRHHCTPGWPKLLDRVPEAEKGAPYFDVVNFASRVKCPVVTSCGFVDKSVSPASVYAMYAELKCEKKLIPVQFSGHGPSLKKGLPNAINGASPARHAWIAKWKKAHNK